MKTRTTFNWRRRGIIVSLVVLISVSVFAASALGDAGNPVPGTLKPTAVFNSNGTTTISIEGQWDWLTHGGDCNVNRAGAGVAVIWNDPTEPGFGPLTNTTASQNLTAATESGTTVTLTAGGGNPFGSYAVGDPIVVSGVSPAGYDGSFTVLGISGSTLTYTDTSGLTSPGNVTGPPAATVSEGESVYVGVSVLRAGSNVAIASGGASESGTTATLTAATAGGFSTFSTGDEIQVAGTGVAGYDGTFTILTVSGSTLTYTDSTSGLASSGGGTVNDVNVSNQLDDDIHPADIGNIPAGLGGETAGEEGINSLPSSQLQTWFDPIPSSSTGIGNAAQWLGGCGRYPVDPTATISTIAAGGTITVNSTTGLSVNDSVTITGDSAAGDNGNFKIATIPNSTTLTVSGGPGLTAGTGGLLDDTTAAQNDQSAEEASGTDETGPGCEQYCGNPWGSYGYQTPPAGSFTRGFTHTYVDTYVNSSGQTVSGLPTQICVNIYDLHANNAGFDSPPTIIAAGSGNDNDNSIQTNNYNVNANCVTLATTGITTTATNATAGGSISDTATLTGIPSGAGGSVTFTAYPNSTCAAPSTFSSTVPVSGNGSTLTIASGASGAITTAGSYYWTASYSGSTVGSVVVPPAASPCGATGETSVVSPTTPSISTSASATVAVGGTISDTATLSGATSNATGTITFKLYGPNDATCSTTAVFSTTKSVSGNGSYTSALYTPTAPGTYRWTASYGGDTNNGSVSEACNGTNESVLVTSSPTITTSASGTVVLGAGTVSDTATLAGGTSPTGSVTFKLYGPNDGTCSTTAVFTSVVSPIAGDGSYTSASYTPTAAGTYRWTASYSGDTNNGAASEACNGTNESVVVSPASPTITTNASATVVLGAGSVSDTATLAGGVNPTGTITFSLYGPNDATCSTAAVFSTTRTATGDGPYTSASYTPTAAGTYRWTASYGGDSNNNAVSETCNGTNESVIVSPASPTITTNASATVVLGAGTVSDTATLAGGANPTGTITFKLYGPNDGTCSTTAVFTSVVSPVAGDGAYTSASYTPTAAGTYRWTASYSGDTNNNAVSEACNGTDESVIVSPASPTITTNASATVVVGAGSVSDTATLTGVTSNATGTITFSLYGPNDATCSTAAVFSTTKSVSGNGSYTSASYTPTAPGTYRWTASYGGDTNNNAVSEACNGTNESVIVSPASPTITTNASATIVLGAGSVSDTATLAGGVNPTGTITFSLYGPNDATCSTAAVFSTTRTATGDGPYTSASYTPTVAGTYRWTASYGGDVNNNAVSEACNGTNESVIVSPASPTITTNASSPVVVGAGSVSDTATLTGVTSNATGTITFSLYGPNDATCSTAAVFSTTTTVSGNGAYTSASYAPTAPGTYRWTASYGGDTNNNAVSEACNGTNESVIVSPASPTITTNASATIVLGAGSVSDTATLTGGVRPTGSITFSLYGPNDATCSTAAVFSTTTTVSGNGAYTSASYTPTVAGTYRWTASYGGDTNNNAVSEACNGTDESVVVSPASPTITTNASATIVLGAGSVSDTATLAGGVNPTGTITFSLYGPNDATCSTAAVFSTTRTATGDGPYTSASYTPTVAGTYRWTASYGGDTNNNAVSEACNGTNESVIVSPASPTITTNASAAIVVGAGSVSDTATLAGGVNPTGTITFSLYGPNDATCSTAAVFSTTRTATGDGPYTSASYTPTVAGTYRWTASYGGDTNNNAVSEACNGTNESVIVSPASPTITTNASAAIVVGAGSVSDTATLAGGVNPTGTITFSLYGPNDATCSTAAVFSTTRTATGDGPYTSASYTPTAPGTYRWTASYGGDVNNNAVSEACNGTNESVIVSPASPTITTNASATVVLGAGPVSDTATLSGATSNATGTITFSLYGPNDATCSTAAVFSTTRTVSGNGTYTSASYTPTAPGTYRWTASYGGDVNNNAVSEACNGTNESVIVSPASPTITTNASAGVIAGTGTVSDTATLAGGVSPTGTITFSLYGPNDATCSTTPIFTSTVSPVTGDGLYTSASYTPTVGGTYRWTASYSGNANNNAVSESCNGTGESVVVTAENPVITITKTTSTPIVLSGGTATFTITIGNTGNVTLTNVSVSDAIASGCAQTPAQVALDGPNFSSTFAPGATASYTCTQPDVIASETNSATDTGTPPLGPNVTATATANVTVQNPAITITKTTSTPAVLSGGTATFTITIGNTGNVTLTNVSVSDAIASGCAQTPAQVALDGPNFSSTFAPGATASYTCTQPDVIASETNSATDTGTPPLGPNVTATATANVTVQNPAITITKTTSTPAVLSGGTATFTITIGNTGNVTLTNVSVGDAIASGCAQTPAQVALDGPNFSSTFAPGATASYTCTQPDVIASETNSATDTGTPPLGPNVTATATANVTVQNPAITITKTTSTPTIASGGTATFTILVTNTGNVTLTSVNVTDALTSSCDATSSTPGLSALASMAPGAQVSYTCSLQNVTAGFTNVAITSGTPPIGPNVTAQSSAVVAVTTPTSPPTPATVVSTPSIKIVKDPTSQTIAVGGTATFTITVTNTGNETLRNVVVSDPRSTDCDHTFTGTLGAGNSESYTCTKTGVAASFENIATVSAKPPTGPNVGGTAHAHVVTAAFVPPTKPAISIVKSPKLQTLTTRVVTKKEQNGATSTTVSYGTAHFTIKVTNVGNTALLGVKVADALSADCNRNIGNLAAGASRDYTCSAVSVKRNFTNIAIATGHDAKGTKVSARDHADVHVTVKTTSTAGAQFTG